ncbi:MAG: VWA domain-containing protein [Planctomycetes bacterium]|nr:VWA domain-containing protein [Planctomycetota bacterium]
MKTLNAVLTCAFLLSPALCAAEEAVPPARIEVAFVLDTTGSMSGLIEGAKAKIWSIANRIATGEPAPDLKIGLVAFRDQGDEYVTRAFDLSADLDAVYRELWCYSAGGGGDGPEHVNAALHEAVFGLGWSAGTERILRVIFLVGDAPPHMDYDDGKDYREICAEAVRREIIVNTIRCGGSEETAAAWQDIAKRSEGTFTTIDQSGGVLAIETPLDARLAELNGLLARSSLPYGSAELQSEEKEKVSEVASMPAAAAADRAEFAGRTAGAAGEHDLLAAVRAGRVDLDELSDEELPEEFRSLTLAERRARLDEIEADRAKLLEEITRLSAERRAFLDEALKKAAGSEDAFDARVLAILREQAKKKGID